MGNKTTGGDKNKTIAATIGTVILTVGLAAGAMALLTADLNDSDANVTVNAAKAGAVSAPGGLTAADVDGLDEVRALRSDSKMVAALTALENAANGDSPLEVARIAGDTVYIYGNENCYKLDCSGEEPTASVLEEEVAGVNEGTLTGKEEKAEENYRKGLEQKKKEEAEAKAAAEAAAAESTYIDLDDADELVKAGIPKKAASSLWNTIDSWCEKKGLEAPSDCKAEKFTVNGKKVQVELEATRSFTGGEEDVSVLGTWDGSKWSFKKN